MLISVHVQYRVVDKLKLILGSVCQLASDIGKCSPFYSITNAIFAEAFCHGVVDPLVRAQFFYLYFYAL